MGDADRGDGHAVSTNNERQHLTIAEHESCRGTWNNLSEKVRTSSHPLTHHLDVHANVDLYSLSSAGIRSEAIWLGRKQCRHFLTSHRHDRRKDMNQTCLGHHSLWSGWHDEPEEPVHLKLIQLIMPTSQALSALFCLYCSSC